MSSEWPLVPLEDLTDGTTITYGVVKPGDESKDGVLFIRGGDVVAGRIDASQLRTISREVSDQYSRTLLRGGELLISLVGNPGEVALVPNTLKGANIARQVGLVRIDPLKADSNYLQFFFRSKVGRDVLLAYSKGSVQQVINLKDLKAVKIPLPELEVQRLIATSMQAFDDRITLLRETNTTLEAIAQAQFKSWFMDFDPVHAKMQGRAPEGMDEATAALFPDSFEESELGPVPMGWRFSTLGKSFELTMGQSPPGDTYNQSEDGLPFYQGRTDFGFRFPTKRIFCNAPTRLAEIGDALVSVRAPVGDVNMAIERCCIGRGVASVRHQSGCLGYTLYAMKNLGAHFKNFDTEGTIFGSINKKDFEALPVVVPSQGVLVAFDEISKSLDGSIEINEQKIRVLVEIRDTLLPRLLSGQLSVSDFQATLAT